MAAKLENEIHVDAAQLEGEPRLHSPPLEENVLLEKPGFDQRLLGCAFVLTRFEAFQSIHELLPARIGDRFLPKLELNAVLIDVTIQISLVAGGFDQKRADDVGVRRGERGAVIIHRDHRAPVAGFENRVAGRQFTWAAVQRDDFHLREFEERGRVIRVFGFDARQRHNAAIVEVVIQPLLAKRQREVALAAVGPLEQPGDGWALAAVDGFLGSGDQRTSGRERAARGFAVGPERSIKRPCSPVFFRCSRSSSPLPCCPLPL